MRRRFLNPTGVWQPICGAIGQMPVAVGVGDGVTLCVAVVVPVAGGVAVPVSVAVGVTVTVAVAVLVGVAVGVLKTWDCAAHSVLKVTSAPVSVKPATAIP